MHEIIVSLWDLERFSINSWQVRLCNIQAGRFLRASYRIMTRTTEYVEKADISKTFMGDN